MISRNGVRVLMASACLLTVPTAAQAQDATNGEATAPPSTSAGEAVVMDPLVVTATGSEQALRDAPASISVLTREELENKPMRDLTDILGSVVGVTLSRGGNQRTVQIRGLPSRYTLILIDGKRVDSDANVFRGNDYDTGWIPLDAIERVEVVRGPMSTLYGSDAMGGVVNIITRKVGPEWTGSLTGDYIHQENRDAGDSYKGGFYMSGPLVADKLGLQVYGSYDKREADGDINPGVDSSGEPLPGFPESKNYAIDGKLSWTPNRQNDVIAEYGYSDRDHDGFELDRHSASLTHRGYWDFGTTEVRAYGDRMKNYTGTVTGEEHPNKAYNGVIDGKTVVPWDWARQTFTIGGEFRYQELDDSTNLAGLPGTPDYGSDSTASVKQGAFFLEDEIRLMENLLLTLGGRVDDHENFGTHVTPRSYLVWHATDVLTFKGGYSQGFKSPTLLENSPAWGSVSCGSPTDGCFIIGNPDLEPETSSSYEIGAQFDFEWLGFGGTMFRNDIEDMISIANRTRDPALAPSLPNFVGFLPDGRPIFAYENIAEARTQGVELTFWTKPVDGLTVNVNYTHLDANNLSGDDEVPIAYQPRHSGNLSVDWQATERLGLTLTGNYIGHQYTWVSANGASRTDRDAYYTLDIATRYALTDNFILRAGVLNITDKTVEREVSDDYNEDGRRYFISGTVQF